MTQTETLASLLRRAAEKWPEKFNITKKGVLFIGGEGFSDLEMCALDDPYFLSLDRMDAIAGAVGMEFEVRRIKRHCWAIEVFNDVTPIPGDLDDSHHPTKRSASIAALCAVLEYAMKENTP